MGALLRCLRSAEGAFSAWALPSEPITAGYRALNEVCKSLGLGLPFSVQREAANRAALKVCRGLVEPSLKWVVGWEGRVALLLRWCAAGNRADFRSVATEARELTKEGVEEGMARGFVEAFEEGLSFDECWKVVGALKEAREVAFVHDNCGEIAFDALLIRELGEAGKRVTFIVHGPISSDASLFDAEAVGLCKLADEVLATSLPTLGLILADSGGRILDALRRADAIIVKGQANFYQFSEPHLPLRRGAFLISIMRTKCRRTFRRFGLEGNGNVVSLLRPQDKTSMPKRSKALRRRSKAPSP